LTESVERLQTGSLPRGAVSITFDDGYANNVAIAAPLLAKYGMTATVFLSSAYIESGAWYPFLQLKMLRLGDKSLQLPEYKSSPVDDVLRAAGAHWPAVEGRLTSDQRESLRPLSVAEVRAADFQTIDFGAHSHTHGIPRNEHPERRRAEVLTSVRKVAEWTGRPVAAYSYPNGGRGDFGDIEKEALRAAGVPIAVSGIAGANRWPCDPLELKRYPLTLHHDSSRFRAEVTGFRTLLLSVAAQGANES
jgi:peptidoglycan/xylan/chitin deacetylase (PgdA/CDA1 family)